MIQQRGIYYIERIDRKTYIYVEGEKYETYGSLSSYIKELSEDFVRCYGGYIVNLRYVDVIEKGSVILSNKVRIPVGGTYQDNLMKLYMRFLAKRM